MRVCCRRVIRSIVGLIVAGLLFVNGGLEPRVHAQKSDQYFSPLINQLVGVTRWQPIGNEAEQQAWLAESLQTLSAEDLSGISEINLLPVKKYRKRLEEAGIVSINPNASNNARRIKKATGAEILLIGTYQIKDRRIQLSAVFYDPQTQETLAGTSQLGTLGSIKSLETKVIKDLLQKSDITLGSSERNWLNRRKQLAPSGLKFEEVRQRPEIFEREPKGPEAFFKGDTKVRQFYEKSMYVGLHYPGASIGFRTSYASSVEIRGSSSSDITVLGARYNHRFYRFGSSNLFYGIQGSHIDFTGDVSEGTGLLGGGFFGFQQFFTPTMSFQADFGGYFISLEDDATGVTESGLGFALNTGLAIHFL